MTYQVLARKWRPQDFSSLVGQEHVVTALRNALNENRIAQAYLFSGIRGVGKTTAARVLAKALNCERRTGGDPCNDCDACRETGAGNNMDVIEVDAATYSKVEQVRELTETLRYGPAGKYKVVVLDEVHRLSKQAFDALLKIVEEPPAHLVFIFATTEIDAVPATILSRCQEFQFRRVPSPVLAEHLRTICDAEEITVGDVSLRLIARAGEGSVRDSVALLDQMATFGSGTITDEDAKQLLGGLDSAIFQKLLGAILSGSHGPVLEVVADIEANGWDPHNVYSQFLAFCRDALHLALGSAAESIDLPEEEQNAIRQTVQPFGYESLLQVMQLLISSEGMVRRSELGLLALEIAWLRAAELPKVQRLQDFLSGRSPLPAGPSGNPGQGRGPGPASPGRAEPSLEARSPTPPARSVRGDLSTPSLEPSARKRETESAPRAARPTGIADAPASPDPAPADSGSSDSVDMSRTPALLEILGSRRQSLAAHLRKAQMSDAEGVLTIHPSPGNTLLQRALDRKTNREVMDQAVNEVWGPNVRWALGSPNAGSKQDVAPGRRSSTPRREPEPRRGPPEHHRRPSRPPTQETNGPDPFAGLGTGLSKADLEAATELPTVRSVLEIFGGKIRQIEPLIESTPEEQTS